MTHTVEKLHKKTRQKKVYRILLSYRLTWPEHKSPYILYCISINKKDAYALRK